MRKDLYEDLYKTEEVHWWHISKRRFVENLINKYAKKRHMTILDVGCGTGKNLETLNRYGTTWGVDISQEALSFCKKRGLLNVKKGEAEQLPFEKNMFDIVCALDVLEHVDDVKSIREIKDVLTEEGRVIVTVPAFGWLWSRWDVILHHKRRYTRESLQLLLEREGFAVQKNTYIHSFLTLPVFIIRKLKGSFDKSYSSDFQMNNPLVNKILLVLSELEQMVINRYDMPFGTSVLCIAQKKPTR